MSRTGRLLDARGGLLTGDAKQPVQVLPRPGSIAQDVGAVLREPFGPPFADDDPGHDAAQDEVREQAELGRGERGDGVVPGDQVKPGTERVGTIAQHVGDGDREVVDQRGHRDIAEVDDAAHAGAVRRDQRVVRAEVVVHELGAQAGQASRQGRREPAELLLDLRTRGAAGEQGAQPGQLGEIPQQRPVHQRVVEAAQGAAQLGQGGPEGAAQRLAGGDRPEQAAVEVAERVYHAAAQRPVRHRGPQRPVDGGHDARHRQLAVRRLDVPQHPDLDVDHRGIGAQVRELHHVAVVIAGFEQEVVVGLAGEPGELAGQGEAGPDGFGRVGRGNRRGRSQPGHVQVGVWGHAVPFGRAGNPARSDQII